MGKPRSLLEALSEHAASFGAEHLLVENKDGREWVSAGKGGSVFRVANYPSKGRDARELIANLIAGKKKPVRALVNGRVFLLQVTVHREPGGDAFRVDIRPAPPLDPLSAPAFTAKQGQYLAFLYNFTKMHRQAPSEADFQDYFRVTAPTVHEMIKTLNRNGLIDRTPGKARSIRLAVSPEHLPRLE